MNWLAWKKMLHIHWRQVICLCLNYEFYLKTKFFDPKTWKDINTMSETQYNPRFRPFLKVFTDFSIQFQSVSTNCIIFIHKFFVLRNFFQAIYFASNMNLNRLNSAENSINLKYRDFGKKYDQKHSNSISIQWLTSLEKIRN